MEFEIDPSSEFTSDFLDKACHLRTGHTNWGMLNIKNKRIVEALLGERLEEVIVIHVEPEEEEEHED